MSLPSFFRLPVGKFTRLRREGRGREGRKKEGKTEELILKQKGAVEIVSNKIENLIYLTEPSLFLKIFVYASFFPACFRLSGKLPFFLSFLLCFRASRFAGRARTNIVGTQKGSRTGSRRGRISTLLTLNYGGFLCRLEYLK